jgi:hypothetical protein
MHDEKLIKMKTGNNSQSTTYTKQLVKNLGDNLRSRYRKTYINETTEELSKMSKISTALHNLKC